MNDYNNEVFENIKIGEDFWIMASYGVNFIKISETEAKRSLGPKCPVRFSPKKDKKLFTKSEAIQAIRARINGIFDDPQLKKIGPLTETIADISRIERQTN